jgi:hypothetical protein
LNLCNGALTALRSPICLRFFLDQVVVAGADQRMDVSAALNCFRSLTRRKKLLAMMDRLTGNLRNTQKLEQIKAELKAKSCSPTPQQPLLAPSPAPAAPARASRLDHAASMALMPSTACLPMPQNVSEEPLALMQPLPGSQGTALLQPLPCAQQCSFSPMLPPPLSDACELVHCVSGAGSSVGSLGVDASALLQQNEQEQSITEQLLNDGSEQGGGIGQGIFDIQQSSELDDAGLQLPKQSSLGGNTPLDTCLAQLGSGADPTVPESEGAHCSLMPEMNTVITASGRIDFCHASVCRCLLLCPT